MITTVVKVIQYWRCELYKGIFWCYWSEGTDSEKDAPHIIATRVLCDADGNALEEVELSSKRGSNFNHKAEWERKAKDIRFNFGKLPYNYFPRGRVEINKSRIKIFASPIIVGNISAQNSVVEGFCIEDKKDEIQWKADNSKHYQYIDEYYLKDFDFRWDAKFGKPRTREFTWEEFSEWMTEITEWDYESEE